MTYPMRTAPDNQGYLVDGTFLFGPDHNPWYQSLEHALLYERERVTVLTRPTRTGDPVDDTPTILVSKSFTQTYVWPVFRHLCHLGI